MSITAAEILTFVNANLNRAETSIDTALKLVLRDLAGAYALRATDTTQAITGSTVYLTYPVDALDAEGAIISVQLSDTGQTYDPLKVLPGGWNDYQLLMAGNSVRGTPEYMIAHNRKVYLYPAPNGVYTSVIDYFQRHADSVTISFSDDWKNAILFGVTKEVAVQRKMPDQIALWNPRYEAEKQRQINAHEGS